MRTAKERFLDTWPRDALWVIFTNYNLIFRNTTIISILIHVMEVIDKSTAVLCFYWYIVHIIYVEYLLFARNLSYCQKYWAIIEAPNNDALKSIGKKITFEIPGQHQRVLVGPDHRRPPWAEPCVEWDTKGFQWILKIYNL